MIATMVDPILLAVLITRYDDMWYAYLLLAQSVLALGCFLALHAVATKLVNGRGSSRVVRVEMEEKGGSETACPFLEKPKDVH